MEHFKNLLDGLGHADLSMAKAMVKLLENKIISLNKEIKSYSAEAKIEEYVTYENNYIPDSDNELGLISDLESLGLKSSSAKTQHVWLTLDEQPYSWMSSQGKVVNNPPYSINSQNTTFIKNLMDKINEDKGVNMNSCLVTFYPSKDTNLSLHADDEINVNQTTPICNVSIGAPRTLEFLSKSQNSTDLPALKIELTSGSLCTMLPGCQVYFKHRIPRGSIEGHRYSLSFRNVNNDTSTILPDNSSPSTQTSDVSPTPLKHNLSSSHNPIKSQISTKKATTSVIFGTSITSHLIESKLVYGRRKCVNVSHSGDKISDISRRVDEYYENNDPDDVEKVIFSFGTNDIRFRRGVSRFRIPILELINKTRLYFPKAIIYFQSVLPIKISRTFTAENFVNFNNMLLDICMNERCSYIDMFRIFLSPNGNDYNETLYRRGDPLHLNRKGTGILAAWIKHAINRDRFYPFVC